MQDQISEATTEIDVFFSIFHVEAALTTNMMLEQARKDREADQTILRDMIQAGIRDEAVLLNMLVHKGELGYAWLYKIHDPSGRAARSNQNTAASPR